VSLLRGALKSTNVVSLDVTADRFYPVRVYDGEGNLKYTLDSKQVKKYCEDKLATGKHWRKERVYPVGHPLRVIK
jgi:hypothetical protein